LVAEKGAAKLFELDQRISPCVSQSEKVYRHAQPNEIGWKLFDSMIESTIILVHLGQGYHRLSPGVK